MNKDAYLKVQQDYASKLEVIDMLHNVSRQQKVTDKIKEDYIKSLAQGEFMIRADYLLNKVTNNTEKRKGEILDMFSGTRQLDITLKDKPILEALKTSGEFMKSAELYLDIINLEEKKPENKPTPIQSTPAQTQKNNSSTFKRATNKRGMPVGGSLRKTKKNKKRYNL